MNCWEFNRCGREKGGSKQLELGICPAYPNNGKQCARIVGTLCGGRPLGTFAGKNDDCMECAFYKSDFYARKTKYLYIRQ